MTPGVEVLTTVPLQRLRQRAPSAQYPRRAQCVIAIGYRNPRFAWIVGVTAQRLHRQRRLEPALTGVSGGTLGYPVDLEGPQRAAMSPTRTPSGTETANWRRITSLEGLSPSIGTATGSCGRSCPSSLERHWRL